MLEQLFSGAVGQKLTPVNVLIIFASAIVLGLGIACCFMLSHKKDGYLRSFMISLVTMPAIVSIVILLIGNSVARALSLGGAFALIRFKSNLTDTKDLVYLFFAVSVGVACGMGYIAYAVLFTLLLGAVLLILNKSGFAATKKETVTLRVTVPENLNSEGLLDDILDEYASAWVLRKMRTVDFGSLFELNYRLTLKDAGKKKELLDRIRERNGNLTVALTLYEYEMPTGE